MVRVRGGRPGAEVIPIPGVQQGRRADRTPVRRPSLIARGRFPPPFLGARIAFRGAGESLRRWRWQGVWSSGRAAHTLDGVRSGSGSGWATGAQSGVNWRVASS